MDTFSLSILHQIIIRAVVAGFTAFALSVTGAKFFIDFQRRRSIGQPIREDGPKQHHIKAGTPTAGGVSFIAAIAIASVLWVRSIPVLVTALAALVGFGAIGFWDDVLKISRSNSNGLRAAHKIALHCIASYALLFLIDTYFDHSTGLYIPWARYGFIDLGSWYYIIAVIYIVGLVNSFNLTDGLDGLATGLGIISLAAMAGIGYLCLTTAMHEAVCTFMLDSRVEVLVFVGAVIGGLLGFLWYNARPAQVIMGDTGSMGIGGVLAYVGIMTNNEVLILLIGGVFVLEALSVIIQVGSFKLRGKRVFKMAPIHHHFEQLGWKEEKIVSRFWIVGVLFAGIGMLVVLIM